MVIGPPILLAFRSQQLRRINEVHARRRAGGYHDPFGAAMRWLYETRLRAVALTFAQVAFGFVLLLSTTDGGV